MTKAELLAAISSLPDDAEVYLPGRNETDDPGLVVPVVRIYNMDEPACVVFDYE